SGVEAQQCAVRPVGIETDERQRMIDEVLREQARDQRLADAALFSPEQMNVRHGSSSMKYSLTYHRGTPADGTSQRLFSLHCRINHLRPKLDVSAGTRRSHDPQGAARLELKKG